MGAGGEKEGGTVRRMEDGDRGVYKGEYKTEKSVTE